jgi:hypothetical protein
MPVTLKRLMLVKRVGIFFPSRENCSSLGLAERLVYLSGFATSTYSLLKTVVFPFFLHG